MQRTRILIIEDDAAIRRGIVDALSFSGYAVLEAASGEAGLALATRETYDLLLLDLVLPGPDGFEILAAVRKLRPSQPVIMLTARGSEEDRVSGLQLGADDYVVKPFSVKELLARVSAVLRRSPERSSEPAEIRLSTGTVALARAEVQFDDGTRTELSEREVDLLRYLASRPGRIVSRKELLTHVWQLDPRGLNTRTIDMHVTRLRGKLRDDPADPRMIVTVRGRGYLWRGA